MVAVLWLLGSCHVTGFNPAGDGLPALLRVGLGAESPLMAMALCSLCTLALLVSALRRDKHHPGMAAATIVATSELI